MLYWPSGISTDVHGNNARPLFTQNGCDTLEEAKQCIKRWESNPNIKVVCAYIEDGEKHVVYLENNVDFVGNVHYPEDTQPGLKG